jgi:hypothetical protein
MDRIFPATTRFTATAGPQGQIQTLVRSDTRQLSRERGLEAWAFEWARVILNSSYAPILALHQTATRARDESLRRRPRLPKHSARLQSACFPSFRSGPRELCWWSWPRSYDLCHWLQTYYC